MIGEQKTLVPAPVPCAEMFRYIPAIINRARAEVGRISPVALRIVIEGSAEQSRSSPDSRSHGRVSARRGPDDRPRAGADRAAAQYVLLRWRHAGTTCQQEREDNDYHRFWNSHGTVSSE